MRLLRERNQPIWLFGESDYDAFQRLKRVQLLEPESKGLRNDLLTAMDKVDDDADEAVFRNDLSENGGEGHDVDGHTALEVTIKKDDIAPEELHSLKIKLSSFVALREGTATDDATAAAVRICQENPEYHIDKLNEPQAREECSGHVLRYLKVILCMFLTVLKKFVC